MSEENFNLNQEIDERIRNKVTWTKEENGFRYQLEKWNKPSHTTDKVLDRKIKLSMLGHFLYELNCIQEQEVDIQIDKIHMYNIDKKDNLAERRRLDNLTDEIEKIVNDLVRSNEYGVVLEKDVLRRFKILRMLGGHMSKLQSKRISKLKNLELLTSTANGISCMEGGNIPINVKFLELYANKISDFQTLTMKIPPQLLYLGLCRNLLSDNIQVADENSLVNIIVLDLGDNNICDLTHILNFLTTTTPNLCALTLQGNPCSYKPQYLTEIIRYLPNLETLDNEKIQEYLPVDNNQDLKPGIMINFCRVMGLTQPVPELYEKKKVTQTFHIELECPLMDQSLRNWEEERVIRKHQGLPEEEIVPEPEKPEETKPSKKDKKKSASKNKISEKPSKDAKKSSEKSKHKPKMKSSVEVDLEEEGLQNILKNDKKIPGTGEIVSERMAWSKMIEFKTPVINLPSPNEDLIMLRDTFRSQVIVRLVLLKVLPGPKGKSKPKTSKKETVPKLDPPKETILAREIKAKIPISLKSVRWNNNTIYYSWDKKSVHEAVETDNLQHLIYNTKGSAKMDSKKSSKNSKGSTKSKPGTDSIPLPSSLTCHIGIGIIKVPVTKIETVNQ